MALRITAIVFFIAVGGWYVYGSWNEPDATARVSAGDTLRAEAGGAGAIPGAEPDATPVRMEESAVFVLDQKPGDTVLIHAVTLESAGFIAVHTVGPTNGPGGMLGISEYLPAGDYRNIGVSLGRPSFNGEEFFVMLRRDDGDKVFDPNTDSIILAQESGVITMRFRIDAAAEPPGEFAL